MIFKVFSLFFFLLINVLHGEIRTNKFNVVIFLANSERCSENLDDSGIKCLHFVEEARVKHCVTPEDILVENPPNEADCTELFRASLLSLISYSRNVLGMTTAIASLANDTFSNGLRSKKAAENNIELQYNIPLTLGNAERSLMENLRKEEKRQASYYPFGGRYKSNDGTSWMKDISKLRNGLITDSTHTEVFKPRIKRQQNSRHRKCDETVCTEKPNIKPLDKWGVMATIKLTFFGKLFENGEEGGQTENSEDQVPKTVNLNYMGQHVENYSLFELVKQTLENVEETCDSGFLIIVIGGTLAEISNPYSPLVQSVKYVTENTDESNTLIVLTGTCPEEIPEENQIESKGLIPIYVKGPKCDELRETTELFDIPYAIKDILAGMSITDGNEVQHKRSKREAAGVTKPNKNYASSGAKIIPSMLFCLIIYGIL